MKIISISFHVIKSGLLIINELYLYCGMILSYVDFSYTRIPFLPNKRSNHE
jgi:hypothetical protein